MTGTGGGLFFLELWFRDVQGMLDHFRDKSDMARPNVAENSFNDPLLRRASTVVRCTQDEKEEEQKNRKTGYPEDTDRVG